MPSQQEVKRLAALKAQFKTPMHRGRHLNITPSHGSQSSRGFAMQSLNRGVKADVTRISSTLVEQIERQERTSTIPPNHQQGKEYFNVPMDAVQKRHYAKLIKDNELLRQQLLSTTRALEIAMEKCKDIMPCCNPTQVKIKQTEVVSKLLLGRFSNSTMYPTDEILFEATMISFDIDENDLAKVEFVKAWGPLGPNGGLSKMVNKNVRDRRSSLIRDAKLELYRKLGCPKPKRNSFHQEFQQWFDELENHREGNKWRIQTNEFGFKDPFGSDAVYGAIACAMIGECYDLHGVVEITKEQGGFFLCALEVATLGKTFNPLDMSTARSQMKIAEAKLVEESSCMRRICLVDKIAVDDLQLTFEIPHFTVYFSVYGPHFSFCLPEIKNLQKIRSAKQN